ncbi:MAG: S9 family peptidase, partial [Verrucomicrobiae bacterium]|nr:S9 family peptidase [Verrucomicrobiae bacterium]
EVDTNRLGVTGHSGGGAYSWTVTALDDRVKAAAPLAGMADLQSHVLDGVLDRHCDCNFFINVYRWDFPQLAALAAPRPVLIGATDNDPIFRLDSTIRIHDKVRRVYELYGAPDKLGLVIAPGQHTETPELHLAVLRWFNKHVKQDTAEPVLAAPKPLPREQLRVFDSLPEDAVNTNAVELFAPYRPAEPESADQLRAELRRKVFAGWPADEPSIRPKLAVRAERNGLRLSVFEFASQHHVELRLYLLERSGTKRPRAVVLEILSQADWTDWFGTVGAAFTNELAEELAGASNAEISPDGLARLKAQLAGTNAALAFFAPRGVGRTAWTTDEKALTRIRRRFMLLGQTLDGMRVWDIRCAIRATAQLHQGTPSAIVLRARGDIAVNALYAALFEPTVNRLEFTDLPASHMNGPDYLNVLKVTDVRPTIAVISAGVDIKQPGSK